jgi:hypothetical protein
MGNFWPDMVVGNETLIKCCLKNANSNYAVELRQRATLRFAFLGNNDEEAVV